MNDAWGTVLLIARREFMTRVRTKMFWALLAIATVLFVAVPVVLSLTQSEHAMKIAVSSTSLRSQVEETGKALDTRLEVRVADASRGSVLVADKKVDAYVTTSGDGLDVTVRKDLGDDVRGLLSIVQQRASLDAQIRDLGGDPSAVEAAVAAATVHVHAQQAPDPHQGERIGLSIAAGILLYVVLMVVGQMVAQGVVEEKSSRVVELLLATVKPQYLMGGKILGIGLLGLVQVLVPGALGVVAGMVTGQLNPDVTGSAGTLAWSIAWFVVGFAIYALLFAAAGAMVSRQEDLPGLVIPVTMPLIFGYVIGVSVLPSDPDSSLAAVLSFIPLISPVLMPMRWALGEAQTWQVLAALALCIASVIVLLRVAGRVYRNSVLHSGGRVSLREALR